MNTFDVKTACILSIIAKNEEHNINDRIVSVNLTETLKMIDNKENDLHCDISLSIHILNPRNLVFQKIENKRLLEVLRGAKRETPEDFSYLENHKYFV